MTGLPLSRRLALLIPALVLALVTALAVGLLGYLKQAPVRPQRTAGPGQTVSLAGFSYRLDDFTVAPSFPAQDKGDPSVHGPRGSMIVLVTFTQTPVDRGVALDDHYCDFTLRSAGTTWQPDDDVTDTMRRPSEFSCGSLDDDPLRYGRPRRIGTSFVVPAGDAARVRFQISVDDGAHVVELHQ